MRHACPGLCGMVAIPADRVACPRCWYRLPAKLRSAIWQAYRKGAGVGTYEHRMALVAAFDWWKENDGKV